MSFTRTAKAVVVSCSLAASEQVTVDLTVTFYQVQARVLESQYKDDVYTVTVVKPEGVGDLIDEEGTLMENGKFSFDSTEEIAIETDSKSRLQESSRRTAFPKTEERANVEARTIYESGTSPAWASGCVTSASGADGCK